MDTVIDFLTDLSAEPLLNIVILASQLLLIPVFLIRRHLARRRASPPEENH